MAFCRLPPSTSTAGSYVVPRPSRLYDDGLRFIAFGNTVLPEPLPGQPLDRGAGMALVEGTIRDVLGVGGANALPTRFREVAVRGRVGMIVTRIAVAGDFASASAESTLYCRTGNGWQGVLWGSRNLEVGAVPPIVVSMAAADPQVKAVMNLIDSIGAGFVSAEMKEAGWPWEPPLEVLLSWPERPWFDRWADLPSISRARARRGEPDRNREPQSYLRMSASSHGLLNRRNCDSNHARRSAASRFSIAAVIDCFVFAMSAHGSFLSLLKRAGKFSIVKWSECRLAVSSSQAIGCFTVAPGLARVEYGATAVAPRPFRK